MGTAAHYNLRTSTQTSIRVHVQSHCLQHTSNPFSFKVLVGNKQWVDHHSYPYVAHIFKWCRIRTQRAEGIARHATIEAHHLFGSHETSPIIWIGSVRTGRSQKLPWWRGGGVCTVKKTSLYSISKEYLTINIPTHHRQYSNYFNSSLLLFIFHLSYIKISHLLLIFQSCDTTRKNWGPAVG